jgi:hypothetical protein
MHRPAVDSPDELHWWELREGDRVSHFEYGAGTVDGSGPLWICITWDNPEEHLNHHAVGIVRHLERLPPPSRGL